MQVQTAAQQILFSTVLIEADVLGMPNAISTGTGLLFRYLATGGQFFCIVNNRHFARV
ncbi:MAG TPA: hypothetical protein VII06_18800 [Chloroflexota bacterium]|jgi:hypothetical protein